MTTHVLSEDPAVGLRLSAVRDGEDWVLNGGSESPTSGDAATWVGVLAADQRTEAPQGRGDDPESVPVGTCAIGPDPAAGAVVDTGGLVHGSDNLWVIDASIIPMIPRATTNLPVVALAEHLVRGLV